MPIKDENKLLYPKNWPEIRHNIRVRSADACEQCGVRNHSVGYRDDCGTFHPCGGNLVMEDYGNGIDPYTGRITEYKRAREIADFQTNTDEFGFKYFVIVCTVAHLDHDPRNNSAENLRFLCQKCHNNYDKDHRRETRRSSRLKNQLEINFKSPYMIKLYFPHGEKITIFGQENC